MLHHPLDTAGYGPPLTSFSVAVLATAAAAEVRQPAAGPRRRRRAETERLEESLCMVAGDRNRDEGRGRRRRGPGAAKWRCAGGGFSRVLGRGGKKKEKKVLEMVANQRRSVASPCTPLWRVIASIFPKCPG